MEFNFLQGKLNEPIRMKDEKESKPVSLRVRDAAEALLTIILEEIVCIFLTSLVQIERSFDCKCSIFIITGRHRS